MVVLKVHGEHNYVDHKEVFVKNEGELAEIKNCAPGSIAMTYDLSKTWVLDEDGAWQSV